jgi:hypothetical protein
MHEFALLPVYRIANTDCTLLNRLHEDLDFRLNSKPNVIKRRMFSGHPCHAYVSPHTFLYFIRGGFSAIFLSHRKKMKHESLNKGSAERSKLLSNFMP